MHAKGSRQENEPYQTGPYKQERVPPERSICPPPKYLEEKGYIYIKSLPHNHSVGLRNRGLLFAGHTPSEAVKPPQPPEKGSESFIQPQVSIQVVDSYNTAFLLFRALAKQEASSGYLYLPQISSGMVVYGLSRPSPLRKHDVMEISQGKKARGV